MCRPSGSLPRRNGSSAESGRRGAWGHHVSGIDLGADSVEALLIDDDEKVAEASQVRDWRGIGDITVPATFGVPVEPSRPAPGLEALLSRFRDTYRRFKEG
jgi:hypothetical protein